MKFDNCLRHRHNIDVSRYDRAHLDIEFDPAHPRSVAGPQHRLANLRTLFVRERYSVPVCAILTILLDLLLIALLAELCILFALARPLALRAIVIVARRPRHNPPKKKNHEHHSGRQP